MKKYKPVSITVETYDRLNYISESCGKPKTRILAEIIEEIFGILASLKPHKGAKHINMQINSSILSQTVQIQLVGRSILITGHFSSDESDSVVDQKIREKVEKVMNNE